jgi:hypothetical protein
MPSWCRTHISCTFLCSANCMRDRWFRIDPVVVQDFNHSLAIWENIDVPIPVVPV